MNESAKAAGDPLAFGIGDRLRSFGFRDHRGEQTTLDNLTLNGKPVVVVLCPAGIAAEARALFAGYAAAATRLFETGTSLLMIGGYGLGEIDAFFAGAPAPFPVLADVEGQIPAYLGLGKLAGPLTLIAGPDLRIRHMITAPAAYHAEKAVARCAELARPPEYKPIARHAPVLLIENVLSPEYCQRLIRFWESQQKFYGIVGTEKSGVQTYDDTMKRRWDVPVEDPTVRGELEALIQRRVLGEIKKAFHFVVRSGETMKIGCYDAEQQGMFHIHRDNHVQAVAHRRFAMSLNLNDEFEGCSVRFPEFPGAEYRPRPGEALVFSCSLLHEVLPVTRGRRFGLFGFYW